MPMGLTYASITPPRRHRLHRQREMRVSAIAAELGAGVATVIFDEVDTLAAILETAERQKGRPRSRGRR